MGTGIRAVVEVLAPGTTVGGIRCQPGAASSVLGRPASELVDLELPAGEPWGDDAIALGERVDGSPSPEAALAALQREAVRRATDAAAPDPVVTEAVRPLRPWGAPDVASLTASLAISERRLRRGCLAAVELGPKALHRMLRFRGFLALAQHAIAQGRAPSDEGVALLAAEVGYADQPHPSRECVRLTGLTPRAFLGETSARARAATTTPRRRRRCCGRGRGPARAPPESARFGSRGGRHRRHATDADRVGPDNVGRVDPAAFDAHICRPRRTSMAALFKP